MSSDNIFNFSSDTEIGPDLSMHVYLSLHVSFQVHDVKIYCTVIYSGICYYFQARRNGESQPSHYTKYYTSKFSLLI